MVTDAGSELIRREDAEPVHRVVAAFLEEQRDVGADLKKLEEELGYPEMPERGAYSDVEPTPEDYEIMATATGRLAVGGAGELGTSKAPVPEAEAEAKPKPRAKPKAKDGKQTGHKPPKAKSWRAKAARDTRIDLKPPPYWDM